MSKMNAPNPTTNQLHSNPADSRARIAPIVLDQLPNMPSLLGRAAFKSGHYQLGDVLPALSTEVNHLRIRRDHLHAYRSVCGFADNTLLPATYLHMLAFPLSLNLLIQHDFPMKAMGQVHLRNRISVLEEFDLGASISMKATIGHSELTSRGVEWDIDVSAVVDNQLIWSSTSTYLNRCKTGVPVVRQKETLPEGDPQYWTVAADTGRRYAKISADYNPIHLSDITARLFGFKQAIAHGMWSKARCLAALEEKLPTAGYSVDVAFQRPLFLPADVIFNTAENPQGECFSLQNKTSGVLHLIGHIS
ncbi:MaoC/PaaZ C-terminal domain-containing protein [Porticoccaceae bacterium]|nr:MaoC/PaaZ C-terminal domain-containing protein [Porticoccaceae bacterium]